MIDNSSEQSWRVSSPRRSLDMMNIPVDMIPGRDWKIMKEINSPNNEFLFLKNANDILPEVPNIIQCSGNSKMNK